MVSITLSWPLAILLAILGATWIYQDANKRRMETADMWAVGFFIAFFIPPIIGAVVVFAYYVGKRNPPGGRAQRVPRD